MLNEWINPNSVEGTLHISLEFVSFLQEGIMSYWSSLTAWNMKGVQQMFVDCGYITIANLHKKKKTLRD